MNPDPTPPEEAGRRDATVVPLPRYETVPCPECGNTAVIVARFSDNRVEYLRIRCSGPLTMLVPAGRPAAAPHLRSA